jgi:hypothetical protein
LLGHFEKHDAEGRKAQSYGGTCEADAAVCSDDDGSAE